MIVRPATPAIQTEALTRSFGRFIAVREVSFEVHRGEIFGYLGANGAGKTTTIRMLCGLLPPSAGRAWLNGLDVAKSPDAVKRSIGYMSQRFSLYMDLLVEENLEFFSGVYGLHGHTQRLRIDMALERVNLQRERRLLTGALPAGLRQRLALASALLHEPEILFLDEPTAGVDPSSRQRFWSLIQALAAQGTTIFVTTHYMDEAEYCHRIGLMVDGRLVALDTPDQLKEDHAPGLLCTLAGAGVHDAMVFCRTRTGVLEAQPFGATAHIRLDPRLMDTNGLRAALAAGGFSEVAVHATKPSLEDVFLTVIAKEGRA